MRGVVRRRGGGGRVVGGWLPGGGVLLAGALGVSGVAAGFAPLAAQVAGADEAARVLTLQEALELASESNPRYRRALNQMELSGSRLRQGWGGFLPNLSVGYSTGQRFERQLSWIDFSGEPIANPEPQWVISSNSNLGLNASFEVLDGGRRFRDYDRIRAEVQAQRLNTQLDLDGILAGVQREYLLVQRQKAQLALERDLLAARDRDLDVTQRRFALALIGHTDLLAAELDMQGQRATVRNAEGQVATALISLRVAIGDPALGPIDVDEQLPEPFDPASLDIEALVARSLESSPRVRAQRAQVEMSRASLRADRGQWWPRLSANSNWGRSAYETGRSALFDLNPGGGGGGSASWSFTFSVPIFDGFSRSYQSASLRVGLRNANEDLRETSLQLDRDIRTRFVDVTTAWETLADRERAQEIATQRLQIMRQEYQLANVGIENLRTAINEEARSRRLVVDQRFAFALALLDLYETAGMVGELVGLDSGPGGN